jgi:hypothetical protein
VIEAVSVALAVVEKLRRRASGIAVIQCRFYDLTAFIATPFSDAGKSRSVAKTSDEKG